MTSAAHRRMVFTAGESPCLGSVLSFVSDPGVRLSLMILMTVSLAVAFPALLAGLARLERWATR